MAGKAVAAVSNLLSKVGIKAPWKITGVASTAEFRDYLPLAGEFRAHAPANPPVRPVVPQAEPEHVFDIRYSTRDTRREHMLVGGTNKISIVQQTIEVPAATSGSLDAVPPTPGLRYRWGKSKNLLDYDNNGYT